jgi:hypothetical protein
VQGAREQRGLRYQYLCQTQFNTPSGTSEMAILQSNQHATPTACKFHYEVSLSPSKTTNQIKRNQTKTNFATTPRLAINNTAFF